MEKRIVPEYMTTYIVKSLKFFTEVDMSQNNELLNTLF